MLGTTRQVPISRVTVHLLSCTCSSEARSLVTEMGTVGIKDRPRLKFTTLNATLVLGPSESGFVDLPPTAT